MKRFNKVYIFVLLFLGISVLYPLIQMLIQIDISDFRKLISLNSFRESLFNSFVVTIIATIVSVLIAWFLAYTLNRTNIKHRAILKVILTVPMLIPSISHGLGLINLFGTNGIISSLFDFNIIGMPGIIIGSVMYSFPVAFLMIDDGYNYIDNTMYDSARVLGLNKWETFKNVTFCYMKKPLFSALFAVFTMIFTDYGVPLSIGGKYITLPVFLYKEVIGLLDFSKGTIIGLFLLIPAFISFIFDLISKDYSSGDYEKRNNICDNGIVSKIFIMLLYIIILFIFMVLFSFVIYAFINNIRLDRSFSLIHFEYVLGDNLIKYLFNSLIISIFVSVIGTIIAYMNAYITARVKNRLGRLVHILSIITLAIPGMVLGLSYTIGFKDSFIYNTIFILILVNIIHFLASPYLLAYNALLKVNQKYEVIAKTCNVGIIRIIIDVIIPCTKKTIREMFAYFFVNSMITISAVTFLFSVNNMPLSLLINNYEGNMLLGEAAIISLIILFVNLFVKMLVYLLNRRDYNKVISYE